MSDGAFLARRATNATWWVVVRVVVPTACPIGLSSGMYVHRVSAGRVGVRLGYTGVGGVCVYGVWVGRIQNVDKRVGVTILYCSSMRSESTGLGMWCDDDLSLFLMPHSPMARVR